MTNPKSFNDEINRKSADLYSIMTLPFEGEFRAYGYSAEVVLPVPTASPVRRNRGLTGFFNQLTGRGIHTSREWMGHISCNDDTGNLEFTEITVPLDAEEDESVIFRRMNAGYYIPLIRNEGKEEIARGMWDSEYSIRGTSATLMQRLLAHAGYGLPQVFTSPNDLRLSMTELTDVAPAWSTSETMIIPEDENARTIMQRTTSCLPTDDRDDLSTELSATYQYLIPGNDKLQNLVITFKLGNEFFINSPEIERQEIEVSEQILGYPNLDTHEVTRRRKIDLNPRLLDYLSEGLIDSLGYAA